MRQAIAFFVLFGFGVATDGIVDAYGMTTWAIVGVVCIAVSFLLVFWSERVRR